jgi:hypothetical protein
MRERDRAKAIGTEAELGRYVRFACPAYSGEWQFFIGIAAFFGWGGTVLLLRVLRHRADLAERILAPFALLACLALLVVCFLPLWDRRAGGPTPRLYCFQDGVVVAVRGDLQAYRWAELTLERQKWESGGSENYSSGIRRTLSTGDGRVLVTFRGDEPQRAGYYDVDRLHAAAVKAVGDGER